MSHHVWIAFIVASLPIHFAPGANNVLALSSGAAIGYRLGHLTTIGRYPAYVLIFLAAAMGLSAVLATSAWLFAALKLCGAAYLVWIGVKLWRSPSADDFGGANHTAIAKRIRAEFLGAIANPKAVLFATAFYAQFLDPSQPGYWAQFAQMVCVSLSLEWLAAGVYAAGGASVHQSQKLASSLPAIQKGAGAILMLSGAALLFAKPQ